MDEISLVGSAYSLTRFSLLADREEEHEAVDDGKLFDRYEMIYERLVEKQTRGWREKKGESEGGRESDVKLEHAKDQ